jgi:large subunit ribosomal protein L22
MADGQEIRAVARYIPISPQKVRLVRGRGAQEALDVLRFVPNRAARPVSKVLRSAIANAEEGLGVSRDTLRIHRIFADEAPSRRWRRFGARGRFKPIIRRSSHITVVLRSPESAEGEVSPPAGRATTGAG